MYINQKIVSVSTNLFKITTSFVFAFLMCASVPLLSSSDDEREAWNAVTRGLIDGGLGFDMMGQRPMDEHCGFLSGEDSEKGVHSDVRELSYEPAEQFSKKRKRVEGDERRAKRAPAPSRSTAAHVLSLPDLPADLVPLQPFLLSDQDLDLEPLPNISFSDQDLDSVPLSHAFAYSMLARSDSALWQAQQHSDSVLRETPPPFDSDPELDPDLDPALLPLFLSCYADGGQDQLLEGLSGTYESGEQVQSARGAHVAAGAAGVERRVSKGIGAISERQKPGSIRGAIALPVAERRPSDVKKTYTCIVKECSYVANTLKDLREHRKTHTDEMPYDCYIDGCTMRFTHPGFLWKHQRSVHFTVGDDGQLVAKKIRDAEKPFECVHEGCGYATARKGDLGTHMRTHAGEKPFKCDFPGCAYASAHAGNLKTHKRGHTGEKPFECVHEGCGYATARKGDLGIHRKMHTGEKPYKCVYDGCTHAATSSSDLAEHIRKHTGGDRPFKCGHDGCVYAAVQKSDLAKHMKKHTGEKPFECGHKGCGYAAAQKSNLESHMRTHTGEKPFKCGHEGCGYAAGDKSNLTRHIRANHTGEKPFKCDKCGFSTDLPHALTSHKATHNPIALFTCKKCGYRAQASDFEQHIEKCK